MTTAQESFRMMMRDQVGSWLRELGFKGLIGFQRSTSSTAGGLRFTMNVTVAERERWKEARLDRPYIPEKPSPKIFYGTYIWQEHIGRLMPSGNDRWWSLEGGEDTQPLAVELLAAIRLFGYPRSRSIWPRMPQPDRPAAGRSLAHSSDPLYAPNGADEERRAS